ncbi:MAG: hypothetical protein V4547_09790 [Bacteroidota bacterium]
MKKKINEFRIFGIETINDNMKKCTILFFALLFQMSSIFGQSQVYDNFEGTTFLNYGAKNGVLDTVVKNPAPNKVNNSGKCALYIRNSGKKFDNIKMNFAGKLSGVNAYATYLGVPPKIKMKIYTNAPVGTLVEFLLGNKLGNNSYPEGTNSQYQAYTTTTNAWEELEFKFAQIPEGSQTSFDQIDQITLLFSPNSSSSDTYYFDDITGPVVVPKGKSDSIGSKTQTTKK